MNRMLINATQEEELRMAMVDGQRLYDLNIELPASERKKANIYKGQITRIEPSLEAAFVNYGADRHGFLPLKEISSEYFVNSVEAGQKTNIRDVLKEGQDIVVQIDKEERGNKGAALTTYVSLAGRFIVLKPNKQRSGGVSRRIVGEDRDLARKSMRDVEVPDGMSVILRTAGIDRSEEELTWDIENLLSVWEAIKKVIVERPSPFLVYRESNAIVRALRDYLTNDIGEILIDDEGTYEEAREFVEQVMPHNLRKLKHYTDSVPLFTRYQIESQIESAFAHLVTLPSGGSLVIDHTEALVSIDINSARATKGGDIETTALNTNLESADEVARQLRLRDLGGLVVIDFIDMGPQKNQREVENRLREAVRQDRARVQIGKISRFGLLEMSRQRLRPSLGESNYLVCPRCSGIGNIRSVESLALAILRIIGEEARKERTAKVIAQLPVEVATYLLNEKRDWVQSLESRHDTQVILVANPLLETPHYQVRRVRDDQVDLPENIGISYSLAESEDEPEITQALQDKKPAELAAITTVVATTPAPPRKEPQKPSGPGLFARIATFFNGSDEAEDTKKKRPQQKRSRSQSDSRRRGGQRGRKRSDGQRSDGQRQQGKKTQQRSPSQGSKKKQSKKTAAKDSQRKDQPQAKQTKDQNEEGRPAAKKRRSRGGRRRRRSPDAVEKSENSTAAEQNADTAQAEAKPEMQAEQAAPQQEEKKPRRSRARSDSSARKRAPKAESAQADTPKADKPKADETVASTTSSTKDTAPKADQGDTSREAGSQESATAKPTPVKADPPAAVTKVAQKPEKKQPAPSTNVDDTQPSLPKLVMPVEPVVVDKPVAKVAAEKAPAAEKPAAPKAQAKQQSDTGNGETKAAASSAPQEKKQSPDEQKPAGRLLPWEPTDGGAADSADND